LADIAQDGYNDPGLSGSEAPANAGAGNVGETPATKQGWSGADYRQRLAAPSALTVKQAEDALLLRHVAGRLSTYIICPGVLYGNGEWHLGLHAAFACAWQGGASTIMSMIGDGGNCMPMLHVVDLATCVTALSTAAMDQRYIIMTDDFRGTQAEVMRAISSSVGSGKAAASTRHSGLMSQVRTAFRHHIAP
jgi:nucleoside-diphosphate-sugar epimerase